MRRLRNIAVLAALAPVVAACWGGDYGGYSPSSSTPAPAASGSSGTSVEPTRERSERTILRRDGSVVVVQRDRDGTRTYADSRGNYGVIAPTYNSGSSRRRR